MNPFEREEMEKKTEKKLQYQLQRVDEEEENLMEVTFMAFDRKHKEVFYGSDRSIQAIIRSICYTAVILNIDEI